MEVDRGLSYGQEAAAALAGPAVNLTLALALCRLPGGELWAGLNLVLACFNLLPVGRLDGGRVLRCLLSWLLGPEWACGCFSTWTGSRGGQAVPLGFPLVKAPFGPPGAGPSPLPAALRGHFFASKGEEMFPKAIFLRKGACQALQKQVK